MGKVLPVSLLLLFASFVHAVEVDKKADDARWRAIVFNVNEATALFDQQVTANNRTIDVPNLGCYTSAEAFVACVRAIQGLGEAITPSRTLIPAEEAKGSEWADAKIEQTVGPLVLLNGSARASVINQLKPSERVALIKHEHDLLYQIGQQESARLLAALKQRTTLISLFGQMINFHKLALDLHGEAQKDAIEGKLAVAMANAYMMALDAHAHIDLVQADNDQTSNADSTLSGIGIEISMQGKLPVVVRPIPDQPAEKAGLHSGDLITESDDENGAHPFAGMTIDQIVNLLRGPKGTKVHVHIQRGQKSFETDIVRTTFTNKNVDPRMVNDIDGHKIGYIRLASFMDQNEETKVSACSKIADAVRDMGKQGAEGYILDLRGNGGGLLTQAVCIGGLFAGKKPIVYEKSLATGFVNQMVAPNAAITDKPLAILINGASASASEIVSGAMQGLERAWLVGDRSFGKASVQAPSPFKDDQNLLLFQTIARFYVPVTESSGKLAMRTNQRIGVVPDFEVPKNPKGNPDDDFMMREGDLLPDSLPADTKSWDSVRPSQVADIQHCLDQNRRADSVLAANPSSDYQILKAEEVLVCGGGSSAVGSR